MAQIEETTQHVNRLKAVAEQIVSENHHLPFLSAPYIFLPGFCDVHTHLREPGYSYKETIKSGSMAAVHGGYTSICSMPNLNPVPDTMENLQLQLDIIQKDAVIPVFPYGAITKGESGGKLSDMEALAPYVCAFSDDGRGVQSESMMRKAMYEAKRLGKMIVAHCEDNRLLQGGYIHDGVYASKSGHRGICSESEYGQIARDLKLVEETGCSYHVCHISTKESVDLIRKAKKQGIDVTCETAPHYLILCDNDLKEDGRFKMNPPLRSKEDQEALLDGISDGTIDMIATDHAPHSAEEKSGGLPKSLMGVVGLETAFPVLYTELVRKGKISLEELCDLLCINPRKRFRIPLNDDYTVFDISSPYRISSENFLSKGRSTPFEGMEVYGRCVLTVCNHKVVYSA